MKKKSMPSKKQSQTSPLTSVLGGDNLRRETTGCPTGLSDVPQAEATQQPGGGGAPETGEEKGKAYESQRKRGT